ncbi:MAG TPA: endonuclease/exonuclease/phosphatase family protein, partial [Vicinamibacterales bacterium]|nr:endonuclease/exonuclease/phosphatase family protein [Vicinamibacterales bacterium]
AGAGSAAAQSEIVLHASSAPVRAGKWVVGSSSSAAGGALIRHPDAGAAKVRTAYASPSNYFEMTFHAEAGKAYRLWIRGRAQSDYWANDSVFVQFAGSVNSSGSPVYRIGTTSAAEVNLEECSGCGLSGWKWQDNGYGKGVLGSKIYFASTGTQRVRVQTREDGLSIDQIVLSASAYVSAPPSGIASLASSSTGSSATDITLLPSNASRAGKWTLSGSAVRHPDAGASKISTALASPSNYFEMSFNAVAGKPYRLWLHGRADSDYWGNDSVFVQFSGSVNASGSSIYRIGTASAAEVNLEDCSGCGLSGWKWQDNGYGKGVLGPVVYFSSTGTHRIRVQTREDGLSVDRIVLSPTTYLTSAPPAFTSSTSTSTSTSGSTSTSSGSTSGNILKVLHWNIHHGVGTDGACNLDRIASWIVKTGANVVALNEVEKYSGWCGNIDMPARILSLVKSKTGKSWYYNFAQRDGNTNGQGNMILTTFPIESAGDYQLSYSRSVARVEVVVGSRRVNIFSTHLDADSGSRRATQMRELTRWASTYPEQRILAGDYNAWPGGWELANMKSGHHDAWAKSKSEGTAVAYSGNEAGNTRRSRIDFIFFSKGASGLELKQARVFDVRDSRGVMPSDHRPLMATYEVD